MGRRFRRHRRSRRHRKKRREKPHSHDIGVEATLAPAWVPSAESTRWMRMIARSHRRRRRRLPRALRKLYH